jgi:hypothetical protein
MPTIVPCTACEAQKNSKTRVSAYTSFSSIHNLYGWYWHCYWHLLAVSLTLVDLLASLCDRGEYGVVVKSVILSDDLCGLLLEANIK